MQCLDKIEKQKRAKNGGKDLFPAAADVIRISILHLLFR